MEISDGDDKLFAQYPWGPIVKCLCNKITRNGRHLSNEFIFEHPKTL